LFKHPEVSGAQSFAHSILDAFAEVDGTPTLDSLDDDFVEPWDQIMQVSRAVLAVSDPRPTKDGYKDVQEIFSATHPPANEYIANIRTSVTGQKMWASFLEEFWPRAVNDAVFADDYDKYLGLLEGEEELPTAELDALAAAFPEWKRKLRPGGTAVIENAIVAYFEEVGGKFLALDFDDAKVVRLPSTALLVYPAAQTSDTVFSKTRVGVQRIFRFRKPCCNFSDSCELLKSARPLFARCVEVCLAVVSFGIGQICCATLGCGSFVLLGWPVAA
jgi:hypothetical protein